MQSSERIADDVSLKFEKFLADLSARLLALSPEQVPRDIQRALEEVSKFFGTDRLTLLRLLPDRKNWIITHNVDVSGISPYPTGTPIPVSQVPWIAGKLIDRKVVSFASPMDLPEEAASDKQLLEEFQVRSGTYIPIAALRSSEYTLGISSAETGRAGPEEHIPRLRLLGELFINALERSKIGRAHV